MMSHVLVIGMGVSGQAAAALALRQGFRVSVYDAKSKELDASLRGQVSAFFGEVPRALWQDLDLCVMSSGIPLNNPLVLNAQQHLVNILSEIDFAAQYIPHGVLNIGVTGTNGKTTMCMLLHSYFQKIDRSVYLCGNIGIPLSSIVEDLTSHDVLIIELSSFQLSNSKNLTLDIAMLLNLAEDHLDWHDSLSHYYESKMMIFDLLSEKGRALIDSDLLDLNIFIDKNLTDFIGLDQNDISPWIEAVAVSQGLPLPCIGEVVEKFHKAPHRLQPVRSYQGVQYINDSKATNLHAMNYALAKQRSPVVLIFGGKDKGLDLQTLPLDIWKNVKHVIVLGEISERVQKEWRHLVSMTAVNSLENAVSKAAFYAKEGDIVLLSPGCSSYDMFNGYEQRGDDFMHWVKQL